MKTYTELLKTEYSTQFDLCRQRAMVHSYFKYGPLAENYPNNVDAIASLKKRLSLYEATGNTDFLVDVGNLAMIEFMRPRHPRAFYRETTREESPGLVGFTVGEAKDMLIKCLNRLTRKKPYRLKLRYR